MRESLLPLLRCPTCQREQTLAVERERERSSELREGTLRCSACEGRFAVSGGIVELLPDPPDYVVREAAGLERFASVMRADGWNRERILALPYVDLPYWWAQRRAFEYWSEQLELAPGQWLLDLGANACWASALFAQRGLSVIALDIASAELQGLRTADYFIEDRSVYFERVLATMAAPPLADARVDYVFCCEALHHNAPAELRATLRECHRILRPGGSLMLVNEPLRFPLRPKRDHGAEVAAFEGNEHVYFLHEYVRAARAAGFETSVRWPRNIPRSSPDTPAPSPPRSRAGRIPLARQARAAWKLAIRGDASLNMLCRKPEAG